MFLKGHHEGDCGNTYVLEANLTQTVDDIVYTLDVNQAEFFGNGTTILQDVGKNAKSYDLSVLLFAPGGETTKQH